MSASVKRILFQRCKKVFYLTNFLSHRKQYIFTNCTHLNGQGSTKPCVNLRAFVISPREKTPHSCKTTPDSKCVLCILGFFPHLSNSYSTLLYGSPPWSLPCSRWRRKTCSHSLRHRSASPDHCQSWQVAAVCHVRGPQGGGRSSRLPESKVNFFWTK